MNTKQNLLQAFAHAAVGMKYFFLTERNAKVQAASGSAVIILSFFLKISPVEWTIIILCIAGVLSLEMLNSAIEKLCDIVESDYHPSIKIIKDVAAAAVLFASVISVITGCIIFLPKIFILL